MDYVINLVEEPMEHRIVANSGCAAQCSRRAGPGAQQWDRDQSNSRLKWSGGWSSFNLMSGRMSRLARSFDCDVFRNIDIIMQF